MCRDRGPAGQGCLDGVAGGRRQRWPRRVPGVAAHQRARERARRPKVPKLACLQLAVQVTGWLQEWWSPQEITARLRIEFAGDPVMQMSHETIYQVLFVQGRGGLRRELARCLRTGRATPAISGAHCKRSIRCLPGCAPGHWQG
jgi:IS30 family transposase